jgi:hypothetical protein
VLLAGEPRRPAAPPVIVPLSVPVAHQEARHAARELTRGAVEVARGVLDGIRAASRSRVPGSSTPTPTPTTTPTIPPTPRGPDAPRMSEAFAMQTLSEGDAARAGAARALVELEPGPVAAAPAVTIPVPPPADGGVLKTAWATVLLAFEVLASLVRGIVRHAARTITGPRASGVRRTTGRVVAASLRLAIFLLVLAVLGGLITLAAVYFVSRGKP